MEEKDRNGAQMLKEGYFKGKFFVRICSTLSCLEVKCPERDLFELISLLHQLKGETKMFLSTI